PDRGWRHPAPRLGGAAGRACGAGGGLSWRRPEHREGLMAEGVEAPGGGAGSTGAEAGDSGTSRRWPRRLLKVGIGLVASILVLALVVVIAFQVSYWPTTLLLRNLPAFNGDDPAAGQVEPPPGVHSSIDVVYRPGDEDGRMDVFWPEDTDGPLPTVVWVHGGAFVAGTKDGAATYLQTIAA